MDNVNLIVIPVHNEYNNLERLLPKLRPWNALPGNKVVIINDGSVDNSEEIAKKMGFEVISSSGKSNTQKNLGKSRSFQKGVEYAVKNNFQHIATFDADFIRLRTGKFHIFGSVLKELSPKINSKKFVESLNYVFDELKSNKADMLVLKQFEKDIYTHREFCGQRVFRVSALKPFLFNTKWKLIARKGFGLEHSLDYLFLTTGRKIINSNIIAVTGPSRAGPKQFLDLEKSRNMIQARELYFYRKLNAYALMIEKKNPSRANNIFNFLRNREDRFISSGHGINSRLRVFSSSLNPMDSYSKEEKIWKNLYEKNSNPKLFSISKPVKTARRRKK